MVDQWTTRIEPDVMDGRVDLPDELLKTIGIGDKVDVVVRDGQVIITPSK